MFFPPRFDTPFLQPFPECHSRTIRDLSILYHALSQQLKRPVIASLGRVGAGHGDEGRFGVVIEFGGLPGARGIVECAIQAACPVMVA